MRAAALPQAAQQLGDILARAKDDHVLEMEHHDQVDDPDLTSGTESRRDAARPRDPSRDQVRMFGWGPVDGCVQAIRHIRARVEVSRRVAEIPAPLHERITAPASRHCV